MTKRTPDPPTRPPFATEVVRMGSRRQSPLTDLYYFLLTSSWSALFGLMLCTYLGTNALFAALYFVDGGIENARPGSFLDAFFFSVQTMATIGYGKMTPSSTFANGLVAFEALFGLVAFALATGLMFAKFSQPRARVLFSRYAVVTTRDGARSLMVRLANERTTGLVEATVRLSLVRDDKTPEGESLRRIHSLHLTRASTPFFALSWTAVHPIDASSPLHGATKESLDAQQAGIVASLVGMEEGTGQTVNARHTWSAADIRFEHRFVDILVDLEGGRRGMDMARFHDVEPARTEGRLPGEGREKDRADQK
jgi:inward rectifier potassium channel